MEVEVLALGQVGFLAWLEPSESRPFRLRVAAWRWQRAQPRRASRAGTVGAAAGVLLTWMPRTALCPLLPTITPVWRPSCSYR